jgi:hypothetical protein
MSAAAECEKLLCKYKIFNKKDHIKKMLEIKKKNPGNFEENLEYKHLAQCLTNINDYPSEIICNISDNEDEDDEFNDFIKNLNLYNRNNNGDIDFIIKNLYSSNPKIRKRAEDMLDIIEKNKSNINVQSKKSKLSKEEEDTIRRVNPELFEEYKMLELGIYIYKSSKFEKECERDMNKNAKESRGFNKQIKEFEKEIKLLRKKNDLEIVPELEAKINDLKQKVEMNLEKNIKINAEREDEIKKVNARMKEELKEKQAKMLEKIKKMLKKPFTSARTTSKKSQGSNSSKSSSSSRSNTTQKKRSH